jgi:hypothetical protein
MKRKRLLVALGATILLGTLACLLFQKPFSRPAALITVHYIAKTGSWDNDGPFPPGAKFLISNNTPKTVIVTLDKIEVRTGSVWAVHSALSGPPFTLAPHRGTYATIEPDKRPLGPWRIRASAVSELSGASRAWAAISSLANRWVRGRSYPGNPLSNYEHYYGQDCEVPSQEVPNISPAGIHVPPSP